MYPESWRDKEAWPRSGLLDDADVAKIRVSLPAGIEPSEEQAEALARAFNVHPLTVINMATYQSYDRPKAYPEGHPPRIELNEENAKRQRIRYLAQKYRAEIVEAQERKCAYCAGDLSGKGQAHLDHILPLKFGGESVRDNLQLLCSHCNQSKGGRTDEEYRRIVTDRVNMESRGGWYHVDAACLDHNDACPPSCPYSPDYSGNVFRALRFMMDMRARHQARDLVFQECPCSLSGCPPDCQGCYMCEHAPNKPNVVICPYGEYGLELCGENCEGECKIGLSGA